jgi:hypothetical protein
MYTTLREKIAAEKSERIDRYKSFAEWSHDAHAAGMKAVQQLEVQPMIVRGGARSYYVADGVCGFAWVSVSPANSSFGRWAKEHGWRKAYGGGIQLWVGLFNQSMQRKSAYADAYAESLRSHGIPARSGSRMD